MINVKYQGTFTSFLCIPYRLGRQEKKVIKISEEGDLFADGEIIVYEDKKAASEMEQLISSVLSPRALLLLKKAFLARTPGTEEAMYRFICKGLSRGRTILDQQDDPDVLRLYRDARKIENEVRKYLGILRFQKAVNQWLYAAIEPETDIFPLISTHFKKHYPAGQWVIHDTGRRKILIYQGGVLQQKSEEYLPLHLNPREDQYDKLWKNWFNSMTIKPRQNSKLQKNILPLKYRKHMTEFN